MRALTDPIEVFTKMEVDEQEPECDDFTGQREPPLHEWIKGVLNRYPGGQIFKVILIINSRNLTHKRTVFC